MALASLSDALPTPVPSARVPSARVPSARVPSARVPSARVPSARVPAQVPGLAARMASVSDALAQLLADLDPGLLVGRDAAALYGDFCRLERLVTGGKTLLAPRIAESGLWEADGHRSAAAHLAELEGGTAGAARRTLDAGRRLVDLPGTEAAVRGGRLSG